MIHVVHAILILLALLGAFFIGLFVWALTKLLNELENHWKKEPEDE